MTTGGVLPGAYGLRLPGMPGERWLAGAPETWPVWHVARRPADGPLEQALGPDRAMICVHAGAVEVDRASSTTTVLEREPQPDAAFVHPLLAVTAIVHADWHGRLVFHGGAVLDAGGGAWGVLADRGQGKSTVLADLARTGRTVLSDDLVVTDGEVVLRGPRCIDLREPSARALGVGEDLGVVGARRRWRAPLGAAPPAAPLRGWVTLDWGDAVAATRLVGEERAAVLTRARALRASQDHPLPWLAVLARPVLRLVRPRSLAALDAAAAALLEQLDAG